MKLAWLKKVDSNERERRQWVAGNDAVEAREMAADLRERVLDFKEEVRKQGVAFATDRDAWDAFRKRFTRAHMEFAGRSADDAIAEYAFGQFKRIWNSERHRKVHFAGNGTIERAPTVFTVGHDEMLARTDVLEALKLRDREQRDLAVAEIEHALDRLDKDISGRERRRQYLIMVVEALKSDKIAIENTMTGEIMVQALLPGADTEEMRGADAE